MEKPDIEAVPNSAKINKRSAPEAEEEAPMATRTTSVPKHHAPIPGMIPVPGGPQEYDTVDGRLVDEEDDELIRASNGKEEDALFRTLLCPDDIYNEEGVYWADLPLSKRVSFNWKVELTESKREFAEFWSAIKKDPLSPLGWYFRSAVIPGAGLLLEGYVLFSVGNIKSLFADVWPECWGSKHPVCNGTWLNSVNYLEICGIIVGQILVGIIGDGIGRRWGLIQDAVIMFVGLLMLTAMWGTSLNGWVICYAWSLFFYSIGVGGEYPMTATSGMERTNFTRYELKQDRLHRGRRVVSAFLMQGWGQLLNQAILIICLLMFHHGSGNAPYSKVAVQWTFRVSFAIPAVGTLWLVYFRTYKMPLISKALERAKKQSHVTGYDWNSLKLAFQMFGGRLLATCGCWFMNDVFFYGNKIFQGQFIKIIAPSSSSKGVMLDWLYNLINIGCSMAGYYLASWTVDTRFYGRNWMMQLGFLMDFVLFVVPAFHFKYYKESNHVHAFQAMYFLSSFFQQFGPNCVTFLVAAEVYPTPVRASSHGLGAATGKLGALMATILYNYIDDQTKFYFVPWFGLVGMLLTVVFMPDVTGLDLREQDRRWRYIMEGRGDEYHGVAIHPMHLSLWERLRGVSKNYNAEADFKQKVHEMRQDWEERQRQKFGEQSSGSFVDDDEGDLEKVSPRIHNYFVKTSPMMSPMRQVPTMDTTSVKSDELKLPEAAQDASDVTKKQ